MYHKFHLEICRKSTLSQIITWTNLHSISIYWRFLPNQTRPLAAPPIHPFSRPKVAGVSPRLCLLWRHGRGTWSQQCRRGLGCPRLFCVKDVQVFWTLLFIFFNDDHVCRLFFWGGCEFRWKLCDSPLGKWFERWTNSWDAWPHASRFKALQQYIAAAYPTLDATQQAGLSVSGLP